MKLKYGKLEYSAKPPFKFNEGLRVEYMGNIPNSFYKYYSPSSYNFSAVSQSELYCAHPYEFNDLTDSNPLTFDYSNLTYENYQKIYLGLQIEEEELLSMYNSDKANNFNEYRIHMYSLISRKIGIVSFSEKEMHNLMWGYYASDSGFKVKFNVQVLVDSINGLNEQSCLLFPINYIDYKLHIDVMKYNLQIPLLVDISTKVKDWEHEKEWRIVIEKPDMKIPNSKITPIEPDYEGKDSRLIRYDTDCIEEIVFGMNFFNGKIVEKVEFQSQNKNIFYIKNEECLQFLVMVSQKLEHKTFAAGIFTDYDDSFNDQTAPMKRSLEKIYIQHIDGNKFSIERIEPGYLKKFENQ